MRRAVAENLAVPYRAKFGRDVVDEEFAGVGDAEFEVRPVEALVVHITVEHGRVAVTVAQGDVPEVDYARAYVHAVGGVIPCVGEAEFQTQAVGEDFALKVDILERAE